MTPSTLHTYIDVLMQHILDLMGEAEQWPEDAQEPLRHCWTHVDAMMIMLMQPDPPARLEIDERIAGLETELQMLEQFDFGEPVLWHLQVLRNTLIYVAQDITENHYHFPGAAAVSNSAYIGLNSASRF
jgi:hypothetical protein